MPDPWDDLPGPPRVVVTIPPLYSFVRAVAGDEAGLICLCKDKGPHHYAYDVQDAQVLRKADLFFSVGLTLDDHFADKLASGTPNPKLRHVRLGGELPKSLKIPLAHPIVHGDHTHTGFDPHVWLGAEQAVAMVETIRDQLSSADSDGAAGYRKNAERYVQALRKLHADGRKMLAGKKNKRLVTFHESLGYFAKSYGLTVVGAIEPIPGDEATAGRLTELKKICQEQKVAAIIVEPQYPKTTSAEALRKGLSSEGLTLDMIEIDPLETTDPAELERLGADWYETKMRENLTALAKKLP
jgi:ABC-type Zn uptake system ZnuABC Zn-binding protein ZnuA